MVRLTDGHSDGDRLGWMKKIRRLVSFIYCSGTRKHIIVQFIASSQVDSPDEVKAMKDEHSSRLISSRLLPVIDIAWGLIIHRKLQLELCALLEPARLSNAHIRVPDVPYHNVDRFVCSFISNTRI